MLVEKRANVVHPALVKRSADVRAYLLYLMQVFHHRALVLFCRLVLVSQHFFALKLNKSDVVTVLKGLANASVVTDPSNAEIVNNGGPAATVRHGWNGFRYESEDELTELTRALFAQPGHVVDAMRGHARNRAMDFSKASFTERWRALLREFGAGTPFVSTTS